MTEPTTTRRATVHGWRHLGATMCGAAGPTLIASYDWDDLSCYDCIRASYILFCSPSCAGPDGGSPPRVIEANLSDDDYCQACGSQVNAAELVTVGPGAF